MRLIAAVLASWLIGPALAQAQSRPPNIIWITSEDNGPQLGAYGDRYAVTPHLDALAARGVRYLHAWSTAPVCAPARTAIITGLYPSSTGAEHMRSTVRLPADFRLFPQFLRERGYYVTNNVKEDYNVEKPGQVWDESSATAHWRDRKPGQPFFAVFNTTVSHESQVRVRPHDAVHDPAEAPIPPYHPDVPEVRQDWAQYYDKLTEMDRFVGERLTELDEAGLTDDTIVFYYGDHGPGMPRSKRWPYDSGLHVPLIVFVPERFLALAPEGYRPGAADPRLVSFVDLAPTVLSLAGVEPPAWMQGHAFMGPYATPAPRYQFGLRGRMDERYDLVRSVSDGRYVYIRNYMPHRIYGQYLDYMFQTPTTRVWYERYEQGLLAPPETFFWEPKPFEELYDLQADPHEVRNLASHPGRASVRDRLRAALHDHLIETRDLGFLPEYDMRQRSAASTPWELAEDDVGYDVAGVLAMAEAASDPAAPLSDIERGLGDEDAAVRFWAAMGYLIRGAEAVGDAEPALRAALSDPAPGPRIAAGEALARYGSEADRHDAIEALVDLADVDEHGLYVTVLSLNALAHIPGLSTDVKQRLQSAPQTHPSVSDREGFYIERLTEAIVDELPRPYAAAVR